MVSLPAEMDQWSQACYLGAVTLIAVTQEKGKSPVVCSEPRGKRSRRPASSSDCRKKLLTGGTRSEPGAVWEGSMPHPLLALWGFVRPLTREGFGTQ